jgi:large subunit ribosomal protein L1
MKHGKKYLEAQKKYEAGTVYELSKAVETVKSLHYTKFDESIDLSVKLNLKKSQSVRDTVVLPNQFRAEKRILVFCKPEKEGEAKDAGAAFIGADDLIDKIKGGWLDFDVAVATPDMMKDVGKLGMILGRKGLMPNPKTGTVTFDLKGAIAELKKGRVEFRADKTGVVHLPVGKISMDSAKIAENVRVVVQEIIRKRPSDAKGAFVSSVSLSGTMSPGVWVQVNESAAAAE